jgi:hypothetical protein
MRVSLIEKPAARARSQPNWGKTLRNSFPPSDSQDGNFRIRYLPESKALVLRINVIQDSQKDGSVAQVAQRLSSSVQGKQVDRFVIDLRECHGGDNQKFRALLLKILRSKELNRAGRIFTIIDRGTFSAAVNASSDLERLSNTPFVGEPTAGAPSSWGDPKQISLPQNGLVARISTVYWHDWTNNESRPWIAPDIPVGLSSKEYFAGQDTAMSKVLEFPIPH